MIGLTSTMITFMVLVVTRSYFSDEFPTFFEAIILFFVIWTLQVCVMVLNRLQKADLFIHAYSQDKRVPIIAVIPITRRFFWLRTRLLDLTLWFLAFKIRCVGFQASEKLDDKSKEKKDSGNSFE